MFVCVCVWDKKCSEWEIVTKLNTFAGWTSLSPVEYVIQNQANDYLPSPQALTQF